MRREFGILLAILVLTLGAAEARQAGGKQDEAAEKLLIANVRALHEAVARADKAAFVSLVLPEGAWTTKFGFVPMALLQDGLDGFRVTKWDIVNPRVIWLDDDAALVTYVWTGAGTLHDHPLPPTALASTVWTKRNGKWLAVHHQQTELVKE